jgi:hypothetical protein
MKTPSIFEIAIEAIVTITLIALLGLLTVLIYALLSFLNPETTQSVLVSQTPIPEVTKKNLTAITPVLPATTFAPLSAKSAPKLKEEKPETIVEVDIKPIDYRKMTVLELRPLARERKITNWKKLKKQELITALNV